MMRAWLACLVVCVLTCMARGQAVGFEAGPTYDPWALPATVAEVQALCEQAGVDAAGQGAAKALVEGCEALIKRDGRRMQRAVEKSYMTHPSEEQAAIQEDVAKAMEKRTAAHEEASKSLLADLKAVMPAGSEAAWSAFERRRHRRLYLHQGWRMGVGMDLVEVAKEAKIDTLPDVGPVLAAYEVELDR